MAGVVVTLGITTGTLAGTLTATTNAAGLATFNGLSVGAAGDYALVAEAATYDNTGSSSFTITGGASPLVVTTISDAVSHTGVSLRDALAQANTDAGNGISDTITFAASLNGQTVVLSQGMITLTGAGQRLDFGRRRQRNHHQRQ